ncbi:MAG TPA: hypothetical protein VM265_08835 [Sphingomicrobium sp.]|nr:hypothetical protein [Sphingomicrobium sp.]
MFRRMIFAAGMGYLMRRFMGGGRGMAPGYSRTGLGRRRGFGW